MKKLGKKWETGGVYEPPAGAETHDRCAGHILSIFNLPHADYHL